MNFRNISSIFFILCQLPFFLVVDTGSVTQFVWTFYTCYILPVVILLNQEERRHTRLNRQITRLYISSEAHNDTEINLETGYDLNKISWMTFSNAFSFKRSIVFDSNFIDFFVFIGAHFIMIQTMFIQVACPVSSHQLNQWWLSSLMQLCVTMA